MTRALLVPVVGAVLLAAGASVAQGDEWMGDAELLQTFGGVTIDGTYASGLTFREQYFETGKLDYREAGGRSLVGHWSVVAGSWCTIYTVSNTGGCFRVKRVSANCYEFYFRTRTEAEAAVPEAGKPSWTARAWLVGSPPTCREAPVV